MAHEAFGIREFVRQNSLRSTTANIRPTIVGKCAKNEKKTIMKYITKCSQGEEFGEAFNQI